jgi:protocatechuate 3,4-dioxygenase beta subunit
MLSYSVATSPLWQGFAGEMSSDYTIELTALKGRRRNCNKGIRMSISRRRLVIGMGAAAIAVRATEAAELLPPTPQETFGPYFPVRTPRYHDFDLTRIPGRAGRALGQVIEVSGRVVRVDGSPVKGAALEIWQANAAGRYANPIDKNPAPLDPNFAGVALLRTTAQGGYRILTVKPGAYPDPTGGMRTPHIHFDVTSEDYRLVAQMYFPGEALNDKDILMSTMPARHRNPALTICKAVESQQAGILKFEWDIVLLQA